MQIKDLKHLGVSQDTIDKYYVDIGQIIGSDEFAKHIPGTDHRERTVDRLITSKFSFGSNANILYTLMKRYVKVECPNCQTNMLFSGGGGSGGYQSTNYRCETCKTKINLTLPHDGISVIGEKD